MLQTASISVLVMIIAVSSVQAQQVENDWEQLRNDLKNIAAAFNNYDETYKKAPQNPEDLIKILTDISEPKAIDRLKSDKVAVYYGCRPVACTEGTDNTVLAYERGVPIRGGYVVTVSGIWKKMTVDEFKKAPKPPNGVLKTAATQIGTIGKISFNEKGTEKEARRDRVESDVGGTTKYSKTRTIKREISFSTKVGLSGEAELKLSGTIKLVSVDVAVRIRLTMEKEFGERWTEEISETAEHTINLDKNPKVEVIWIDVYRTGSVQITVDEKTHAVPFEFPVATRTVIKAVK